MMEESISYIPLNDDGDEHVAKDANISPSSNSTVVSNCSATVQQHPQEDTGHESKGKQILDCLHGNNYVNVWQLRTLALQHGGLLSIQYRKQAWPKLLAAHVALLSSDSVSTSTENGSRHTTNYEKHQPISKQDLIRLQENASQYSSLRMNTFNHNNDEQQLRQQDLWIQMILTILQQTPETENPYVTDDRYRYYDGLLDITILLWRNLESPSLTVLLLKKLAMCHLRDFMRPASSSLLLEETIRCTILPLLQQVDPKLLILEHSLLVTNAIPWVQSWGCCCHPSFEVASRLADVILASHPVMPM